tara:strand:- start:729 stop:2279 length:1551 start_codon:yes stop_codon:yes gene_type:complete
MNKDNITQKIQILINQFNAKNFELVITNGNILLKKNPEYVILYNLVGSAYQNQGNFSKAKNNFIDGLKLDPKNISLMNNLAMAYKNLLQYDLAEELYLKILSTNDKYINAYVNLGNLKRDLNKFDEAIKLYEKALSLSDKNPIIYYSLALAHQGLGNFEKSIEFSKKTLNLNKNFTRADHLISQSTKYTKNNSHYLSLKEKLDTDLIKNFEKVDIYFSLSKAEEDIGNIKESIKYLLKGNKLKSDLINHDVNLEINLFKIMKETFDKFENETINENKNAEVIFILGMPRSGTSLVEQIITSHSNVFGGGELPILSNIVKLNFITTQNSFVDNLKEIIEDPLKVNKLKLDYLKYINNFKFDEKFITDKAPLNFRWIGFIKVLFPNAKIIHCTRDPKNNCLSMFKNLFEGGLNFTYDQSDLVKYYKSYEDLMNFWNKKFTDSIFEVKYENLISNNEKIIKEIIKFCNLNWEDDCLNYHNNKTPIKTMSTAQARKPIYKTSLNQFEKYKEYLEILEEKL